MSWLKTKLEGRFEFNTQCISPSVSTVGSRARGTPSGPCIETTNGEAIKDGSEARLLNRVVRCTADGWEVEPDQRHADNIIQDLQLSEANGCHITR